MRNRLIHGYFGVDYQIIWQVINENINDLKEQMKKILRESK